MDRPVLLDVGPESGGSLSQDPDEVDPRSGPREAGQGGLQARADGGEFGGPRSPSRLTFFKGKVVRIRGEGDDRVDQV